MSTMTTNPVDLLRKELSTRYSLNPTDQWLTSLLSTLSRRPPPLPALTQTAHFRLLSTDITTSLIARPPFVLPVGIDNVQVKSATIPNDVPVQILDIVDTSTSRYSQIEAIERVERGEEVRGREVIRNVAVADDDDDGSGESAQGRQLQRRIGTRQSGNTATTGGGSNKGSTGPHKLLLQDAAGTKVWAFELSRIDRITIVNTGPVAPTSGTTATAQTPVEGIQIGCKLLLKSGTNVRRGMVMLTPANTIVMGGKVEAWDGKWREGRKGRLQRELDGENVS